MSTMCTNCEWRLWNPSTHAVRCIVIALQFPTMHITNAKIQCKCWSNWINLANYCIRAPNYMTIAHHHRNVRCTFLCTHFLMKDNRANCFFCEIEIKNKFTFCFFRRCDSVCGGLNPLAFAQQRSMNALLRVLYLHFNRCQNGRVRTHAYCGIRTNWSISSRQCPTGAQEVVNNFFSFFVARM